MLKSESDLSPDNTKLEAGVRTRGSLKLEAEQEAPTSFKHSSPVNSEGNSWLLKQNKFEDKPNLLQQNAEENEKFNNILAQNSVLMNKSLHHQTPKQSLVIQTPQVFMQNNFNGISPSALMNNFQMQQQRLNAPPLSLQKHTNINSYNFPLLNSLFNSGFDNTGINNTAINSLVGQPQNYHLGMQYQASGVSVQNNHLNSLLMNNQTQLSDLANIQSLLNQMSQQPRNINPYQNNFF